ncbi:MAG TPA: hypothetical protein PLB45_05005 [Bacilli bacterium]|nr:hypothetical protein [Bacilli bacterium]
MKYITVIVDEIPGEYECPICKDIVRVEESMEDNENYVEVIGCKHAFINVDINDDIILEFYDDV